MPYTADRVLLRVLAVLLAAAPGVFMFATAWGVEPERVALQQSALLALSAIAGLCVLALALRGHRAASAALYHPAVLVLFAVAAAGGVMAVFHQIPGRTIIGLPDSPYHHMGSLWYVETGLLVAGYLVAARGSLRLPLAIAGALAVVFAATVTAATLTLNYDKPPWLGVHFPDWYNFVASNLLPSGYLAWIAPVGIMAAITLFATGRRIPRAMAVVLLIWIVWVSSNSTAAIGLAVGVLWIVAERVFPVLGIGRVRTSLCVLLIAAPVVVVPLAAPIVEKAAIHGVNAAIAGLSDGVPSLDPRDHVRIEYMPGRTLWSRSWMQRIVIEDMVADPSIFLVGRGWGSFAESYAARWREVPGRRFRDGGPLLSKTHWDAHTSSRFHPHNTILEAIASLGFAGAILIGVLLVLPAARPKPRAAAPMLLAVSLCTISGFWFFESSFAPFLAAAYAATIRSWKPGPRRRPGSAALFAVAAAVCMAGAVFFGARGGTPRPLECGQEPASFARYESFLATGLSHEPKVLWLLQRLPEAQSMACGVRFLARSTDGLNALSEMLRLRDMLLTGYPGLPNPDTHFPIEVAQWKADVLRLLDAAPGRTDVIVPYISWMAAHREHALVSAAIAEFRPRVQAARDPVGAWLDACQAFLAGDAKAHRRMLTAAMEGGLANYVLFRHLGACAPMLGP